MVTDYSCSFGASAALFHSLFRRSILGALSATSFRVVKWECI